MTFSYLIYRCTSDTGLVSKVHGDVQIRTLRCRRLFDLVLSVLSAFLRHPRKHVLLLNGTVVYRHRSLYVRKHI